MVLRYRPPRFIEFFSGNVKARRQRFLQKYGYPHSDKRKVDEKIVALLEEASLSLSNKEEVCIPIELVLALTLREGFARSPGRAWRGQADEGRLSNAISDVWKKRQRYIEEQGLKKGVATNRAIEEIAAAYQYRPNVSVLRDEWRHRATRERRRRARRERDSSSDT
jgi:hypothetical protein